MEIDLQKLAIQAKNAETSTKKLFDKIKRKPLKDFDDIVHELHEEVFSEIDCLKCGNCCKTLGPRITMPDIEKIAKKFKTKTSKIIDDYFRIDEDGDYVFKSMPCPFISADDNYCVIYADRPRACKEYPHTDRKKFYQLLSITLRNTHVCPAVYHIVELLKLKFSEK